ncbi:hypothetical protein NPIL_580151 [Nephila pilipes]|uniref:Uncharacterized protein n=1 Tax=Nephila pilipes TaxID=299642 RepID=A0A8X6K277_NEPPI|nr:hypothetical protein NPIL_173141 [Nephila pilipes]GFS56759.1 hypothetical protein NPIL_580151 [Nephila pilipes]
MVIEQLKTRAPIELVDHFIDSWDKFKKATILVEKLDHFETVKKVHRKQGSTKTSDRKPFDKQRIEMINKLSYFVGKSKVVGSPKKNSCKDEVIQESSQFKKERMRERKRQIICFYCNEISHIKPSCSRLRKNSFETVANLNENSENEDPFEKFKVKMEMNGVNCVCLRDSESSIDVCARSWIKESDLLGEYVWLKSPLDDVCHCLPLAKIKTKTKRGEFYTKTAIKSNGRSDDPYLLGNQTAKLIDSSEQDKQLTNAVVPRKGKEKRKFEIPPFEGGKEIILAKINGSEFEVEQKKCKDLKVLWDKARLEVDKEFGIYNGKLIRIVRTKREEEIIQDEIPAPAYLIEGTIFLCECSLQCGTVYANPVKLTF